MFQGFKYIVFQHEGTGFEEVILFQQTLKHETIAREHCGPNMDSPKPVRAGFVFTHGGKFFCGGSSMSLNLSSSPLKDNELIQRMNDQY